MILPLKHRPRRSVGANAVDSITAALGSGLVARALAILPTFIAPPIGISLLGEAGFGAVLALLALATWMNLGAFGLHSALGQVIASDRPNRDRLRQLLGSALICSTVFTAGATAVLTWAIHLWVGGVPLPADVSRAQLYVAALVLAGLGSLTVFLQIFEGVNIGILRQVVTNLCRAAGSLIALGTLAVLPWLAPQPATFVAAIMGGQLAGALLLATLVIRTYPPSFSITRADLKDLMRLAGGGASFFVIQIASLVQSQSPVIFLSAAVGPAAALDLGLVLRLLVAFVTVLSMVSSTTWPAIARLIAEREHRRARVIACWLGAFALSAGGVAAAVLMMFGDDILQLWTGRRPTGSPLFFALCGLFFAQVAWAHFWAVLLIACRHTRLVALLFGIEASIMMFSAWSGSRLGPEATIFGLVSAAALTSSWLLPAFAHRIIRQSLWASDESSK